ncbi:hypothetical protein E4U53_005234 [Claviceps sorghi]|nr:hypothetical protein E4U53_005234 [Claviceps sorghi]
MMVAGLTVSVVHGLLFPEHGLKTVGAAAADNYGQELDISGELQGHGPSPPHGRWVSPPKQKPRRGSTEPDGIDVSCIS